MRGESSRSCITQQLLALSHAFASEFASVFWKTWPWILGDYRGEVLVLEDMIKSRPDICHSVTTLSTNTQPNCVVWPGAVHTGIFHETPFSLRCQQLSKAWSLKTFVLEINIDESELENLIKIQGRFKELLGFRHINTKNFHIVMRIWPTDEVRWEYRETLEAKYELIVREILLPFSLQVKNEGLSEKQRYINNRAERFSQRGSESGQSNKIVYSQLVTEIYTIKDV